MWTCLYTEEARTELKTLIPKERAAVINAAEKLVALGPDLPFPHTSAIAGTDRLRELRPRGGRSQWRAFYRQIGDSFVIAAIGPEAKVNPRGFTQACKAATRRLASIEMEDT
jgi:hypothetical protein